MEHMEWIWLGAFVFFAAMELMTFGLTSIWFAVGSLAACLAYLLGGNWIVQAITFIVVSLFVLILVRPYAKKYINNRAEKTNVEAMTGKTAKVIARIDNIAATGMVMVDGIEWTARSANDEVIEKGALVTVVAVEGVKVIVKK